MTALGQMLAGHGAAGLTVLQGTALLPPFAVVVFERGFGVVAVTIAALVFALGWETVFCRLRQRPPTANGVTTALLFAVLAPPDTPLWNIAVAVSLGCVVGELIFGGRGFGFLNAAAVSLALLVFSFPGTSLPDPTLLMALATLPGAVLLFTVGALSWRVVVPAWLAVLLVSAPLAPSGAAGLTVALAIPLVFLIGDPLAAATTNAGRVVYGGLAGILVVVFDPIAGPGMAPAAIVFAALLASVFAPLIDYGAIGLNVYRRGRRHV